MLLPQFVVLEICKSNTKNMRLTILPHCADKVHVKGLRTTLAVTEGARFSELRQDRFTHSLHLQSTPDSGNEQLGPIVWH